MKKEKKKLLCKSLTEPINTLSPAVMGSDTADFASDWLTITCFGRSGNDDGRASTCSSSNDVSDVCLRLDFGLACCWNCFDKTFFVLVPNVFVCKRLYVCVQGDKRKREREKKTGTQKKIVNGLVLAAFLVNQSKCKWFSVSVSCLEDRVKFSTIGIDCILNVKFNYESVDVFTNVTASL